MPWVKAELFLGCATSVGLGWGPYSRVRQAGRPLTAGLMRFLYPQKRLHLLQIAQGTLGGSQEGLGSASASPPCAVLCPSLPLSSPRAPALSYTPSSFSFSFSDTVSPSC